MIEKTSKPNVIERAFARVRVAGNYDADSVSKRHGLACTDGSRTIQSQKDEADINVIVERFGVTGHLPAAHFPPSYGDFSGAGDYHTAMDVLVAADRAFQGLPSAIRATFNNDPGAFVAFCEDSGNLKQLQDWGLAPVKESPHQTIPEPQNPPSS